MGWGSAFKSSFNPDPRKHALSVSGKIFSMADIDGKKAAEAKKKKAEINAKLATAKRATAASKGYTRQTSSSGSLLGSGSGYTPGGSTTLG